MSSTVQRGPSTRRTGTASGPVEGALVGIQTRSRTKRSDFAAAAPDSKPLPSKHLKPARRGTARRSRQNSIECLASSDFVGSHGDDGGDGSFDSPSSSESQSESDDDPASVVLQDVLKYGIPRLNEWCEKVLEALMAVARPESRAENRKNLKTSQRLFRNARRILTEDDVTYCYPSQSDAPFEKNPGSLAIFQKAALSANIISLLLSLEDVRRSKRSPQDFLEELERAIPLFQEPSLPGQSECMFHVRRGVLVGKVGLAAEDVQPLVLASELFCEQPATTAREAEKQLREGPFKGLGHSEHDEDFTLMALFRQEMDEIVDKLLLPTRGETVIALKSSYPYETLLKELRDWGFTAYARLKETPEDVPLQSTYEKGEEGGDENTDKDVQAPSSAIRRAKRGSPAKVKFVPSLARQADEAEEESISGSSSQDVEYAKLPTASEEYSLVEDAAALAAIRQTEQRSSQPRIQPPREAKKPELTASQTIKAIRELRPSQIFGPLDENLEDNGIGGVFDDDEPSQPAWPGPVEEGESRGQRQRRERSESLFEDGNDQDDQDDDYEVNKQVINESKRFRPASPRSLSPKIRKRRRITRARDTMDKPRTTSRPVPSSLPVSRARGSQSDSEEDNAEFLALSQAARKARAKRATKSRVPQKREKWTDAETKRLLELIADNTYGCSWVKMQEDGGFSGRRNQQSIRDRARNLKKWYLCANEPLPRNFNYVFLGAKEVRDIKAAGFNPYRREEDITADGTITNFELREDEEPRVEDTST
ncbi:hypothetical protein F5Y17DRAFT_396415 [Xylariaceae sp. FL0594]|nr:hypothetical protein F5Y17DRAFT_396415 [Xylariaceae sp. FL0594]